MPLFVKEKPESPVAYACGKCGIVAHSKEDAEKCCLPTVCECGTIVTKRWHTACDSCIQKRAWEKEQERLANVRHVSIDIYSGPGYWHNNQYYGSEEELADAIIFDIECGASAPDYVFGALETRPLLQAEDVVESILSGADDNLHYAISAQLDDLQKKLNEWLDDANIHWFEEDSLVVDVTPEWLDAFVNGNVVRKEECDDEDA